MKRMIACVCMILVLLSGCAGVERRTENHITFYYLNKEYRYGQDGGVLVSELRTSSGHRRDISYLMALYLMGPVEEEHTMPVPPGTRIYCSFPEDSVIQLELSSAAAVLSDTEFTLAAACLSMTCFQNTDAELVTVFNGERNVSLTIDSLVLSDYTENYHQTEETQ